MATKKKKVSELPLSADLNNLYTLGVKLVNGVQTSVKVSLSLFQDLYTKMLSATTNADSSATKANNAANRASNLSNHRDKIVDGYWWSWNETSKVYENTGHLAKGDVMQVALYIDDTTGILYQVVDPEYKGGTFALDGNILYSVINN